MPFFRPNSAATTQVSIVTGRNFIANPDAETDTTGWATYADAAGATPVDGTGGSPTVTWTRSVTSPLADLASFVFTKDAANRQGEGASYAFTIGAGDQAKALSIEFDYIIGSGTFVAGTSTADSDITVYIYDVTNAVVIQPSSFRLFSNSSTTPNHFLGQFQTASNSTSYRLIFHAASTSASAYTVKFDNITVGPSRYVYGSPMSAPTSYTPVFTGCGTVSNAIAYWVRSGSYLDVQGSVTVGTVAAALASITLPTGLAIDTSVTSIANASNAAGPLVGHWREAGAANSAGDLVTATGTSTTLVYFGNVFTTTSILIPSNGSAVLASSHVVAFAFRIPIAGWSPSVQMSDQADTRVIAAIVSGDPASATSGNPIIVPTVGTDTHSAYSNSTGRYTCPASGIYKIYGALQSASSATTLTIYKNAVSTALAGNLDSNGEATFCGAVNCVSGDLIDLRPGGTVDATNMTLNIERLSGPSAIAATETISARYYASATVITGSLATVVWSTKDWDTHGAVASGVFTCPVAGRYQVNTALALSGTFALNNQSNLVIQKNNVTASELLDYAGGAETADHVYLGDIVQCVAGDTIRVQVSSGATSPGIVSSNTKNYMSIARLGL